MINKLIHFSVYHWFAVLFGTVLLAVAGVLSFQKLSIDAVPDITNNQVQVNTQVSGFAPEEIERLITFPTEVAMRGIAGVTQVRSVTRFGLSQVTVVFRDDVDIYRARQLVSERLQGVLAKLPKGAESKLGPISTGLGEIFHYAIDYEKIETGEKRVSQLMEIRALQDWYVKPRLLTTEGVAEINTSGGFEKQYQVKPSLEKMAQFGIHFSEIIEALGKTNLNAGGGYIQQTAEQLLVQGLGVFRSREDIARVPVKTLETFKTVRIGDVAEVDLGTDLRTGASTLNGQEAVIGTAMMLVGENSRTVATRVAEKVKEVAAGLPPGVKLTPLYDRSELVNQTLGTVEHNLLTGAFLVILILLVLVGNFRAALITAVTIPLSLLITFIVMKPLGISGNLMSLGALDFGIIVDGTVIVLDNCVRYVHEEVKRLGRPLTRAEVKEAVYKAAVEIRTAAGFGELIIIVVFLPIFGLVGIEGKMFGPMAATFAIAVAGALVLSFTTAPALASVFLSGNAREKEPRVMEWLKRIYLPVLNACLAYRKVTLTVAAFSVGLGVVLLLRLGGEFLPQLGEGSFAFHMIRPVNISINQSLEHQKKAEEIIRSYAEVKVVFSKIGTSEVATDPMGINLSDTFIMMKDPKEWPKRENGRALTRDEFVRNLIARLEKEVPGQRYLASQPIQMRFNELLEGTRADVTVKFFGPDIAELVKMATKAKEIIAKVRGAGDVEVDLAGTSPVLKIEPKWEVLDRYGLPSNEVLEAVTIAIGGEEAGYIFEKERRFPIVVRLDEKMRRDLDALGDLPVSVGPNATRPLRELATLNFSDTFGAINRENGNRRSAVLINLSGRDTESFVQEAMSAVEGQIQLPQGYYMQWGGNFKNLREARTRLLVLAPLALLLVLFMIYAAFNSIPQTLLVFSCVPLALVGGVLGLVLNDLPFSISAGVGFIALSGIAVMNGVVLVNYFNQLRSEGATGRDVVTRGTLIRLRPVLMTALVDIFGFLPMMLSTGVGAEVQKPLASVVIGGVLSSTLLTLLVLPLLYYLVILKGREEAPEGLS